MRPGLLIARVVAADARVGDELLEQPQIGTMRRSSGHAEPMNGACMNLNEAVRRLRVLARDHRDDEWSGLFLALDSAMCDGDGLPDDWRKHRFDDDLDQP